jgi:phosphocarrier protein HPr
MGLHENQKNLMNGFVPPRAPVHCALCAVRWLSGGVCNVEFTVLQPIRYRAMLTQETQIINKLGLHARACAKLTQLASKFSCEVWLTKGERRVNAKSIMGVMMLAAGKGSLVTLETEGADEQEAMTALLALIADYFGEGE